MDNRLPPETARWLEETLRLCMHPEEKSLESVWIQEQFERLARTRSLSRRSDLDRLIFERMYGRAPEKETALLPIRYWRTGRHKPQSRNQCLELGRALELDAEETRFLLQGYYDSADRVFSGEDPADPVYLRRRQFLAALEEQYLAMAHPLRLSRMKIPWEKPERFLRHYYVQDAAQYVYAGLSAESGSHLSSANYAGEFQKNRLLLGEIPRKTMVRHLFLMQAPFLSREILDQGLKELGYLPLKERHEGRFGERLDLLLLRLLDRYRLECTGKSPLECQAWLRRVCRRMDQMLLESGCPRLRFLYFKTLDREHA